MNKVFTACVNLFLILMLSISAESKKKHHKPKTIIANEAKMNIDVIDDFYFGDDNDDSNYECSCVKVKKKSLQYGVLGYSKQTNSKLETESYTSYSGKNYWQSLISKMMSNHNESRHFTQNLFEYPAYLVPFIHLETLKVIPGFYYLKSDVDFKTGQKRTKSRILHFLYQETPAKPMKQKKGLRKITNSNRNLWKIILDIEHKNLGGKIQQKYGNLFFKKEIKGKVQNKYGETHGKTSVFIKTSGSQWTWSSDEEGKYSAYEKNVKSGQGKSGQVYSKGYSGKVEWSYGEGHGGKKKIEKKKSEGQYREGKQQGGYENKKGKSNHEKWIHVEGYIGNVNSGQIKAGGEQYIRKNMEQGSYEKKKDKSGHGKLVYGEVHVGNKKIEQNKGEGVQYGKSKEQGSQENKKGNGIFLKWSFGGTKKTEQSKGEGGQYGKSKKQENQENKKGIGVLWKWANDKIQQGKEILSGVLGQKKNDNGALKGQGLSVNGHFVWEDIKGGGGKWNWVSEELKSKPKGHWKFIPGKLETIKVDAGFKGKKELSSSESQGSKSALKQGDKYTQLSKKELSGSWSMSYAQNQGDSFKHNEKGENKEGYWQWVSGDEQSSSGK